MNVLTSPENFEKAPAWKRLLKNPQDKPETSELNSSLVCIDYQNPSFKFS